MQAFFMVDGLESENSEILYYSTLDAATREIQRRRCGSITRYTLDVPTQEYVPCLQEWWSWSDRKQTVVRYTISGHTP